MSITGVAHRELLPASFKDVQRTKTHELPVLPVFPASREYPEFPVSLVYPVSNGQGLEKQEENMLKRACPCHRLGDRERTLWEMAQTPERPSYVPTFRLGTTTHR